MKIFASELIFWTCVLAVAYNYAGYPLLLFAISALSQAKSDLLFLAGKRSRRCPRSRELPTVAILLSAYNEEAVIQAKVENFLALDYPHDRLELLVGLDATTDSTPQILDRLQSSRLRVWNFSKRQGKLAVLCALAQQTSADIVVTTDANTMFEPNCIRALVRHFSDPKVGAASGEENRVTVAGRDPGAESLYWRYESALKFLENRLNCSLGGNGSVLAVRRSLFRLEKPSIVEDFQIPLDIRFHGYRVVYDPEAIAVEEIAPTSSSQFARRVRLGAGDFQALFGNLSCLNPMKGLPAFCFFSHRVLRWLGPLLLLTAFICSLLLLDESLFKVLAVAQCAFYGAALLGYRRKKRSKSAGVLAVPLHFCSMNLALFLGLLQFLRGRHSAIWKATPRAATHETG
ncbi:MAG TPA: glycosyltransferase family 2 protein [Candidatus Aquilonibacter sp.]|nr:glycosyltransferase family 2 protein [Candidatus Aquilonibacter sp.]